MLHEKLMAVDSQLECLKSDGYSLYKATGECLQWSESQGYDFTHEDIVGQAEIIWTAFQDPPQTEQKAEPPRPLRRELEPAGEFPVDALGLVLGGAARALHESVQSPLAMCGASVLAFGSLAAQHVANVAIDDRTHPLSLYMATLGISGERKTSVDNKASPPIREYENSLEDEYYRAFQEYDDDVDAYEYARKQAKTATKEKTKEAVRKAIQNIGPKPMPPLKPCVICEEPNFEGLYRLFQEGQASMGIFTSEGGRMVGGYGMKDDNKLALAAALSCWWDGTKVKRVRGGSGSSSIQGKRLSLHLMLQPGVAMKWLSDQLLQEQGIFARCLVSYPESMVGDRKYRPTNFKSDSRMNSYNNAISNLLNLPKAYREGSRNELELPDLHLTTEAKQLWIEFFNDVESKSAEGQELSRIVAFANKAAEQSLRIAGVLALVENPNAKTIDETTMGGGIELAAYYLQETLRLSLAGLVSPEIEQAELLLEWLHNKWEPESGSVIPLPLAYTLGPGSLREAKPARKAMKILEEHGWCRPLGKIEFDGHNYNEAWEIVPRV